MTILPWNDEGLAGSPFVAAFTKMGIPYADHVMNAVVLTAVLCCLNSGMYTASRMLFVLAARREAPAQLVRVTRRGVPATAILASSVVGFLCVIAAAFSPDTIFAFLLNSSGAIILFVYLLIAISQIVLRYRTDDSKLRVKMWLFPVLSILTAVGILAILVQMFLDPASRWQLVLSLLSWAVVLVLYFANKWFINRRPEAERGPGAPPHRVLVLANETANSKELLDELRRIGADKDATYFVVVPASPIETGRRGHPRPARSMGRHSAGGTGAARPHTVDTAVRPSRSRRRTGRSETASRPGQGRRHIQPRPDRDCDAAARVFGLAQVRRRGPRPRRTRPTGDPRGGDTGRGCGHSAMTRRVG